MPENKPSVPKNIIILGLVSFFNDLSSEMIYPIVPIFLKSILGAPAAVVGLIEGVAEATASILKVFSGYFSDKFQKRKPLVVAGYSLSAISKFLLSWANSWPFVLFARFLDRTGKGVRTTPRDALIADDKIKGIEGKAFGLHRAMDTMGAVVGPILAIYALGFFGNNFNKVFLFAGIPSVVGVLILAALVKEKPKADPVAVKKFRFDWRAMPRNFKVFIFISAIFALGNSSDAFLILRAQDLGLSISATVWAYVLLNFIFASTATYAGMISDKIGEKNALLFGLAIFAAVYFAFAQALDGNMVWLMAAVYGLYFSFSDGVGKAYIAKLVPKENIATAFGIYQLVIGLGVLLSSIVAGFLWDRVSHQAPFYFGSAFAALALVSFFFLGSNPQKENA